LELSSTQQAALDLRALLEEYGAIRMHKNIYIDLHNGCRQITETERWQRNCWELQEQLQKAATLFIEHKVRAQLC